MLNGKTILLVGGTGSFGQKFTEVVLREYDVKKLIVYSRNEFMQYEMERKFQNDKLRLFIGDVRDGGRLIRAMDGVDIVVNAAALKHVPVCEYNPLEAVKTNIEGAINIIDAALTTGVARIISVSSDKAVNPVNLYGATKLVAEKLFVQANVYTVGKASRFSCVRYGNVAGSRGSVMMLFMEERGTGELTITDQRMTRFWLTIEDAVRFVIDSLSRMSGGEVFVPKIPSMKVIDMAAVIAPKAKWKIIGIRPGEKLHETLISENESSHTIEYDNYYVVEPEFRFWEQSHRNAGGKPMEIGRYGSDNNTWWLSGDKLRGMLDGQK